MTDPIVIVEPAAPPVVVVTTTPPPVVFVYPPGPPGPAGGAPLPLQYALSAVSDWDRTHAFAYPPNVHLVDAVGELVGISVSYPDSTHVHVSFPSPFTGTVVLQ